ncbi:MAG: TorF family putative porin [Acidiferrobacter sp.]
MKTPSRLRPCLGLALLLAAPAYADGVQGQVALLSNYVWRGLSETSGNPALQGTVTYQGPLGVYAQAFASTLDYQGAHERADFSAGLRETTRAGLGINVGETAYRFDASPLDFAETHIGLRFGPLSGAIYRDWQHRNTYVETGYTVGLGSGLHLVLHAGHTFGHTVPSYSDYGAGVTKTWHRFTAGLFVTTTSSLGAPSYHAGTKVAVMVTRAW